MSYHSSLLLFADDFDAMEQVPPSDVPAAEAAPAPPTYGQEELDTACTEARAAGYAQGISDTVAAEAARVAATVGRIAELLADAAASAARVTEDSAEMLSRVLLASVLAGYPQLHARYGPDEVRGLIRRVLPGLVQETRVVFHVHPSMAPVVGAELAGLSFAERQHMTIEPSEAIPPGDARITWPHGAAVREADKVAAAITDILGPLGLLPESADDGAVAEEVRGTALAERVGDEAVVETQGDDTVAQSR